MWQDEGFLPAERSPSEVGERRSLYQGYMDAVNWSDSVQVARAVRVFEQTAKGIEREDSQAAYDLIESDGYKVDDGGRITGGPAQYIRDGALANLTDPTVIREHLDRITRAIQSDDPAQAIGSAKELIESTPRSSFMRLGVPSMTTGTYRGLCWRPRSRSRYIRQPCNRDPMALKPSRKC